MTVDDGKYRITINRKNHDGIWDNIHTQDTDKLQNITIHRLAAHEGTYSFCSKNLNRHKMNLYVVI